MSVDTANGLFLHEVQLVEPSSVPTSLPRGRVVDLIDFGAAEAARLNTASLSDFDALLDRRRPDADFSKARSVSHTEEAWVDDGGSDSAFGRFAVPPVIGSVGREAATAHLNGFIQHESVFSPHSPPRQTPADDDSGSSSADEVFGAARCIDERVARKPLLGAAPNRRRRADRRVHFDKNAGGLSTSAQLPTDDAFNARIRKGRTWRSRLSCAAYTLAAFLLSGSAVCLVVYSLGGVSPRPAAVSAPVCSDMDVQRTNWTWDQRGESVIGASRLIQLDGAATVVTPIGGSWSGCVDDAECEVGVLATNADTLQGLWFVKTVGLVESLECDADIDSDGVVDCTLTTSDPVSAEVLSGADGSRMARLYAEEQGVFYFPPRVVPDVNGDGIPDFLVACATNGDVLFMKLVSQYQPERSLKFRVDPLFRIRNASISESLALWNRGDVFPDISIVIDKMRGLYVWSFWDFMRGSFVNSRVLFAEEQFAAPFGYYVGDSLLACTKNGTVVLYDRFSGRLQWRITRPHSKCIPGSLLLGQFDPNVHTFAVVCSFKATSGNVTTLLMDGATGRGVRSLLSSESAFHAAPLIAAVNASRQDRLVIWRMLGGKAQLVVAAYPWNGVSVLFETEVVPIGNSITDEDAVFRVHSVNSKHTGVVSETDGKAVVLFYENKPDATVTLHRLALSCRCAEQDGQCGRFAATQPWRSERACSASCA